MRPLLVLSVPHTGTMFTFDLLPWKRGQWPILKLDHRYWAHLREPNALVIATQAFTIVPLRSYERVQFSWARRGMDLEDLKRQWIEIHKVDAFFLPLDSDDRDQRLEQLSQMLGTPLKTDWQPTNHWVSP